MKVKASTILDRGYINNYIQITFDQSVTITESFYPPVSVTKLFSEFGGVLGFWLGIGMFQLYTNLSSYSRIFLRR